MRTGDFFSVKKRSGFFVHSGDVEDKRFSCPCAVGANTREKLLACESVLRRRVYKPLADTHETFRGRGGARQHADDLFLQKNKSEQSELCSDVVEARRVELLSENKFI